MSEIIVLENVSMSYLKTKRKHDSLKEYLIGKLSKTVEYDKFDALKNINLRVERGEKIGIIGHNGAGKSTLLKIISGVMKPTEGNLVVKGSIAPLLELGAGFDAEFDGKTNVYLNAAILGRDKTFIESKYNEIIEFADLGEFIDVPIKNYSSGMRAKLGFSVATCINPEVLIIDEILGVGDEKFRIKSSQKIRDMMQQGVTVLIVSHNINQIRDLTSKVVWLDKGEIVEIGPSNEICDKYLIHSKK